MAASRQRFFVRTVCAGRAARRCRLPSGGEPRPGRSLPQRRDRHDFLSLAGRAGPARSAAERDVLSEHLAGMTPACRKVFAFALALAALPVAAQSPGPGAAAGVECDRCGKIESIRPVTAKDTWTP